MLEPAILYADEIREKFKKEIYADRYFFYTGYPHSHELPKISTDDDDYQWAITDNGKIIGYLAYRVYPVINSVENFGLYSFDDDEHSLIGRALVIGRDLTEKVDQLVNQYHRVSWRMIKGNPVQRSYDAIIKKYNGNRVVLHDICKDNYGRYHDEYIYEIINPDN